MVTLENVGNFIRMLVRPMVTMATIGSLIYIAIAQDNKEVVTALVAISSTVATFWFNDRGQQNRNAELGDK